jgi:hypothetical protein
MNTIEVLVQMGGGWNYLGQCPITGDGILGAEKSDSAARYSMVQPSINWSVKAKKK